MTEVLEGFQLFEKPNRRRQAAVTPSVSITRTGQITINSPAIKLFETVPDTMRLLYNPKENAIALQGSSLDDSVAFKIRYIKSGQGIVGAKSFLQAYGIPYDNLRTFRPEQLNESTLIIKLDDEK